MHERFPSDIDSRILANAAVLVGGMESLDAICRGTMHRVGDLGISMTSEDSETEDTKVLDALEAELEARQLRLTQDERLKIFEALKEIH